MEKQDYSTGLQQDAKRTFRGGRSVRLTTRSSRCEMPPLGVSKRNVLNIYAKYIVLQRTKEEEKRKEREKER